MTRRVLTSLPILLIAGVTFGGLEWHTRTQAHSRYRQDAKRFFSAVTQVREGLRSDGAGDDASLYRAQMMASDRANTLAPRDRRRQSELDMQAALSLYASSAGKWAMALSGFSPGLFDEAIADEAKAGALLDRAGRELEAGL